MANQAGDESLKGDWLIVKGFATLGMEERFLFSFSSYVNCSLSIISIQEELILNERSVDLESARVSWKKAYSLYLQAFKEPKTIQEQKKLAKLLKKPLPADVEHDLFDYSLGFLRTLGMVSLSKYWSHSILILFL